MSYTKADMEKLQKDTLKFVELAYCGLVVRGYGNERSIEDPILRRVWRQGKKLAATTRLRKRMRL